MSIIFYLLHDDVTSSSATNLPTPAFDLGFAHHWCPYIAVQLCVAANNEYNDPERDSNKPASAVCPSVGLSPSLFALSRGHTSTCKHQRWPAAAAITVTT